MTEQKNAVENTPANDLETGQQNAALQIATDSESLLKFMEKSTGLAKLKPAFTLTATYLELEKPGEKFRGLFIGLQKMNVTDKQTGELKEITAARFIKDKAVFINGGAVLVNEIERAGVPVGTPLEIAYIRKENNAKIYSITLLAN